MVGVGSFLISLAGPQVAPFWGPLHLMMFALLAWVAPYLRWHGALGAAVVLEVIFLGAKTGWTSERYQLAYLSTTLADMAGMFILAIGSKNWYDLNEAARKTAVELAAMTGSSGDLIAVLDASGLVRSVNGACRAILGYEPGELDGQSCTLLGAPELDALGPQIRAGQPAFGIIKRARRKDGAFIWLEWNVEPLPELEALLCVGRDVTRRIGPAGPLQEP
jgi:PAS domain S-box-containing protein